MRRKTAAPLVFMRINSVFGQPFVKRFALCYKPLSVLSVCLFCLVTLVYCGQTVGWVRMPFGIELDCDPAPQRGTAPNFRPISIVVNGWIDQNDTWYEGKPQPMPHCVRWGPSSSPAKKGPQPPIFGPCLLWPNGWMDQTAPTWYRGRPRPMGHCVRWRPSSPPLKKGQSSPHF